MAAKRVLLYGLGGHGLVVNDILELLGYRAIPYDDDERMAQWMGRPLRRVRLATGMPFIVAIGSTVRCEIARRLIDAGLVPFTAVHPSATISRLSVVGTNVSVCAGARIGPGAIVEDDCIINTNANVEHDCHVEQGTHVAPGATLLGNVSVGPHCLIGAGAVILPSVEIPPACHIGAGAVVTQSTRLSPGETVVGVPGRALVKS